MCAPIRCLNPLTDLLQSDSEAASLSSYILSQAGTPRNRITSIVLDPEADPSGALWTLVLGSEIGQRLTIAHNLPGTKGITAQDFFIERIKHDLKWPEGNHACTWDLSEAPAGNWLVVGDAIRGIVGVNTIGF